MSGPPDIPQGPEMGDEASRVWHAYDQLLRRHLALEEITDRLAATSADPIAVDDYWKWKQGRG